MRLGPRMRYRLLLLLACVAAIALVAAACGGDDAEPQNGDQTPPATQAEDETATEPEAPANGEETPPATPEDGTEPAENGEPTTPENGEPPENGEEPTVEGTPTGDPDREVLVYGETFRASVAEVGGARQFRFEAEAGDLVRIRVDGKDGMDPIVTLLEPNRTEIGTNDDESSANRDSLLVARVPTAGLQVVRVEAFQSAVGEFEITIERLPDGPDDDQRVISIGDVINGVLDTPDDFDVYEFQGTAGQPLRIYVDGALGVDTWAQIFSPSEAVLLVGDDSGHGLDAELILDLPEDGMYRVEVTNATCGLRAPPCFNAKIGPYQFSVATRPETAPTPDPDAVAAMEAVALTYMAALQDGDSLNLFALAGPEAIALWGWESAEDVSRDITKLQSIGVTGVAGATTSTIEGSRGRTTVTVDEAGSALRFDMILVDGQWKVDFWERTAAPSNNETA